VARRVTVFKQERERGEAVLVLDAGNSLVGDREPAKSTQGQTSVMAMNLMGYDAMALSPQDLALGLKVLRKRIAEAKFAVLSANAVVSATGDLLATPYLSRQMDGRKVVVIGLSAEKGTREITVRDSLETVRTVVAQVADQADVIILLSHAGVLVDRQIAEAVPGIDLIVSGGDFELTTAWRSEEMGTLVLLADQASPGHAGRRVGIAQLVFDGDGQLVAQAWRRLALAPEVADDPMMSKWVLEQDGP